MLWIKTSVALCVLLWAQYAVPETLAEQRAALFTTLREVHGLSDDQLAVLTTIFENSRVLGQGNPAVTVHPFTRQQCQSRVNQLGIVHRNQSYEAICGERYMAPLYNPGKEQPADAKSCIDQFEFPNIPCEYPVVWVRAVEAAAICSAIGKRLCDAHEWEGACEGKLLPAGYPFEATAGLTGADAVKAMRSMHNRQWSPNKRWSYGTRRQTGYCASNSTKSTGCNGGDWYKCGSNTYPSGMFPACGSELGGHDFHGNAAEHMNLPTRETEMASQGSLTLGYTEMKGSWFIWDHFPAHQDWCRWRAPYWHGSRVLDASSHRNYHLGFRCCKSVP